MMFIKIYKNFVSKIIVVVVIFCLLQKNLHPSYTGGQPAEFLQFGASARGLAMKAFFSVVDDASGIYYNPAGLIQCDRKEILALHTELFPNTQTTYDFLGFVYPTIKHGVFSFGIVQLLSTGFEKIEIKYDLDSKDIISIENKGTFENRDLALLFGYGKELVERINLGIGIKYVNRKLDVYSDTLLGVDISILMMGINSKFPKLNVACGIKNIISLKSGTEDNLPIIFKLGASHKFMRDRLILGLDIEKNVNSEVKWLLGGEYWFLEFLSLRLGFEGLSYFKETTAGLGFKYKDYKIDYSFAFHELGFSHRISADMKWGKSVKFDKEEEIRRLVNEAEALYLAGRFMEAARKFESAYQIDPNKKEVKKMLDVMLLITAYIRAATEDTEEHQGIRKAVEALINDDLQGAVNALRYAYYKNPANKNLHQLLNHLEKLAGVTLTEFYKEEIAGWTIIDKKIYEAREDVLNGRYTDAIRKCQEVLNLEPKNVTALEIMGSAFFMMNEVEKAKAVWKKVLELDPTNKVVKQFLEELE